APRRRDRRPWARETALAHKTRVRRRQARQTTWNRACGHYVPVRLPVPSNFDGERARLHDACAHEYGLKVVERGLVGQVRYLRHDFPCAAIARVVFIADCRV